VTVSAEVQRRAIARSRERRRAELAPLRQQVARAVAEVGWARAKPVVVAAMGPVKVAGPRGVWAERMGKRAGARILAELRSFPVQGSLPLALPRAERRSKVPQGSEQHPRRSVR